MHAACSSSAATSGASHGRELPVVAAGVSSTWANWIRQAGPDASTAALMKLCDADLESILEVNWRYAYYY